MSREHEQRLINDTSASAAASDPYTPAADDDSSGASPARRVSYAEGGTTVVPMDTSICGYDEEDLDRPSRHACVSLLAALHAFFMMLPVVIVMLLLTFVDVSFLIYEFSTGSERYEFVTLCTATAFFVELLVHLGHLGTKRFFMYDKYWQWAEAIIVSVSFVVEYVEFILDHALPEERIHHYVAYMRAARFLRVFILMKTRSRTIVGAVRRLVSADRRRFQQDGYDLDLTYVLPDVIAMSWPSEAVEAMYRNHIDVVARFLDERHANKYMVYNLCSERSYDESKFHHAVRRYRLDDHNPCELQMMLEFGDEVTKWKAEDPSRVVVIHCKGGKGRTGTMVCTYFLYSGLYSDATSALKQFGEQRTSHNARSFQGVESPSQERYVRYLEQVLRRPDRDIPRRRVRLTRFVMRGVPKMFWDIGKLWFAIITRPSTDRIVHFVSNPTVTFTHAVPEFGSRGRGKSVAPDGANAGDLGIEPFFGNMAISVRRKNDPPGSGVLMDGPSFIAKYCPDGARDAMGVDATMARFSGPESPKSPAPPTTSPTGTDASPSDVVVDVEFSTSAIAAFEGDVVIKVFHNVDDPSTLKCPLQIWFHTAFEGDGMTLPRERVDGPHKDHKGKKYGPQFGVDLGFETVSNESADVDDGR